MPTKFQVAPAPHLTPPNSVSLVMRRVIYALIPGILCYVWYFGFGIVINMLIAAATALACEALMLKLRQRDLNVFLTDYSAVVTAILLAFALPPLTPWWITVIGAAFAIIFAKHLYGGLGYNPFNPAMAGYVVLLISFPQEMTVWLKPDMLVNEADRITFLQSLATIFTGSFPATVNVDAVTAATPLDVVKTQLGTNRMVLEIRQDPIFGDFGGKGWEWISNWLFLGGAWLIYKGVIRWHIPVAVLGSVGIIAFVFYMLDPSSHASPGFHIFGGATMLCAFFIATDPVSAATTNMGRLVYGAGIGIFIYVIRTWGAHPDAVAFSVLLMNMAVPLIEHFTRPRTYGHGEP